MTTNSDLDVIKSLVHRRGTPSPPQIEPLVAEVRTPDELPIQPPDPNLRFYEGFVLMVEWTFAVAYSDLEKFHLFLRDNEQSIADSCMNISNRDARYLGTWWIFGTGPKTYRTLWQYKSDQAITNLKAGLRSSPNFRRTIKELRAYWAKDPGRAEYVYQPAALFSDLKGASARASGVVDPLVELALEP
jgi:hypothetical protein